MTAFYGSEIPCHNVSFLIPKSRTSTSLLADVNLLAVGEKGKLAVTCDTCLLRQHRSREGHSLEEKVLRIWIQQLRN